MECMEEGYIAKIIHGDGAKEIKVGEVYVFSFWKTKFVRADVSISRR